MVIVQGHLRQRLHGRDQGARHLAASHIVRMHHPRMGVATFAAQRQHPRPRFVELRANCQQFGHHLRPFGHHPLCDRAVAQASARRKRVLRVASDRIGCIHGRGNTALRVLGVGLAPLALGHHGHGPVLSGLEGKKQTGNTAAENEIIRLDFHLIKTIFLAWTIGPTRNT